jgi:cellobiose-specific phosphotransferase system component IIA
MEEVKQNLNNLTSPDYTKIQEKPKNTKWKFFAFLLLKIAAVILLLAIILAAILGLIYYNNFKQAATLSFAAKDNLDLAVHKMVNREFDQAAELIGQANSQFQQAKELLDKVIIVRYIPYVGLQVKSVDKLLISGIDLTASGQKVVLLINDIIQPLNNESITYVSITPAQKKEILNKIVASEDLLVEVQKQIDAAGEAIDSIQEKKLIKPLRDGIIPLKTNIPIIKDLIDHSLPMLQVIPQIVGFAKPQSYLFLLQNNNELRPTGGFIGTYGILKLQDGEIQEFETDNIYNLDKSSQAILKEPAPAPIAKYLEQTNWSLRDSNWSPDFPTSAQKALYFYEAENKILADLKKAGQEIKGDSGVVVEDTIPYQPVNGVIAMTPEIIVELLKITGPITVDGVGFSADNFQEELEFQVGKKYEELGIARSERKNIIKKLADQIKIKLMSLPLHRAVDLLQLAYRSLDQKQILIYSLDADLQQLILERGWGGAIKSTDSDYLMVVDSNLGSLKTDQFMERYVSYSLNQKGNDLVAKVIITYKNNGHFDWKTTRLRSYTRVYVPLGSELISSSGAMANDKERDKQRTPGQVEVAEELGKTYFSAFISIEPQESGVLSFEYKLPVRIKDQIDKGNYGLLIQKQPGVIHNLTLALNFVKNIKSASPAEAESEWFNNTYNLVFSLTEDKQIIINLK